MSLYAENTKVPVIQSRGEIERLLSRHKCSQFGTAVDHEKHIARVQFTAHKRIVRFEIALPDPTDKKYKTDRNGWMLSPSGIEAKVAQAERQKWRALLLVIKAKLESVENNIATFEEEFLAHIVLPNQQTVAQFVLPVVAMAYDTGRMPSDRLLSSSEVVEADQRARAPETE
jgi:hypothetical protein